MPPPAQQQQQSGDNSMAPVWLTLLFMVGIYCFWVFAHQYVVSFVFFISTLQAQFIDFFLPDSPLAKEIDLMQTLDPAAVNWPQMILMVGLVNQYFRYPAGILLLVLAYLLYRSDITLRFQRTHTMKTLRLQEQGNWPAIMPVVDLDLVNTDIDTGPWAMAMTPMEFAKKNALLKKNDALLDVVQRGQEMTAGIRKADTKRVFTLQLGAYWSGFDACSPHVKVLVAIFMARINRDRGTAASIMTAMDEGFKHKNMNYDIADAVIKKYQNTELIQKIVSKHAYLLTVMASLLEGARQDGVVASAEFLWLKPVDRRLWYMLNCIGRQTPYVEVGGPFAHWLAEKAMGRRALVPMIDEAVKALDVAIKQVKLTPEQLMELTP